MKINILDIEEGEREIGAYEGTYEDMFEMANRDVQKLLRVVGWFETLDEEVLREAIRLFRFESWTSDAEHLELFLKNKP